MDAFEQEKADKTAYERFVKPLDLDARYSVEGYGGIAFYALGYATEWTEETWTYCGEGDEEDEANYLYDEPEEIEDRSRVRVVMVGDDAVHVVDVEDLTVIGEDDYCHECGQIGCTADGRDRTIGCTADGRDRTA